MPYQPHDFRRLYRTAAWAVDVPQERIEYLMHHRVDQTVSSIYLSEAWRYLAGEQKRISEWLDHATGRV